MKKLKTLAKNSPAIREIDYTSGHKVILAVDTSSIAVGYILSQIGVDAKCYPSRFVNNIIGEREQVLTGKTRAFWSFSCIEGLSDLDNWGQKFSG